MKTPTTVQELKKSGRIIFECVSGSFLYNLNVETSDQDIRGVYINPHDEYLGLKEPDPQIQDDKHDVVYYSLKRFFELLQTANPNICELVFVPKEQSLIWTPAWQKLYNKRYVFMTKKAYYTHAAYATAQIGKARGCNKRVHNPQPEIMPRKEDFCWIIDMHDQVNLAIRFEIVLARLKEGFPFRPVPLKETGINLEQMHLSSLEHVPNVYRMYYYGFEHDNPKGVFRGDQMLCCESIPKGDEKRRFRGLLIYNKEEYEKAVKEWHQYWDWMKFRNSARWIDQEKGLLNYDQKNMCHCLRLILSCENILRFGEPIVRFEGEQREYLMKIRKGEFTYEQIMDKVKEKQSVLESLLLTTSLPENISMEEADEIYRMVSL